MDLSVLIPARNEEWLNATITDVLKNRRARTEIIVVVDGAPPLAPIPAHPDVHVLIRPTSHGQRASTNDAARLSSATYVMKLDAHCAVAEGFDVELIRAAEALGPDVTQIPRQYNLHVFDWQCHACGHRSYQGPKPTTCSACQKADGFERIVVWQRRSGTRTDFWRFDKTLHFQYWGDYKERPAAKGDICDVLTSLGACFFMRRDRFFALGGLDETHGSWGQFGIEIALKSWLSGGRHVVNKRTWYAHLFRTQPGFGFPYELSGKDQERARARSRQLWLSNTWPQRTRTLASLIKQFAPVPEWTDAPPVIAKGSKGLVYYSDGHCDPAILEACRARLLTMGLPIVSATLAPLAFGQNVVVAGERSPLTMFRQILAGLEALETEYAFLVEHDVLYHPSHFKFSPRDDRTYFYNEHTWKVDADTGRAVFYYTKQTSGLCANRALLIAHYRERIARVERDGFSRRMGFEPGTHRRPERIDDYPAERWMSAQPNVDIRHGANLTQSRWTPAEFRSPRACQGWAESVAVPGWGITKDRFRAFLAEHSAQEVAA